MDPETPLSENVAKSDSEPNLTHAAQATNVGFPDGNEFLSVLAEVRILPLQELAIGKSDATNHHESAMTLQMQNLLTAKDPIQALLKSPDDAVLAIIAGGEGPSYRPIGAMMTVFAGGNRTGTLSSGCIEADIALHAQNVLRDGHPKMLRYGRGSPYIDIRLPCGGGLDILLVPRPDKRALSDVIQRRARRELCALDFDLNTSEMSVHESGQTGLRNGKLRVRFDPEVRFLILGKGPEAATFASLVQVAGYPNTLLSPDEETLQIGRAAGCDVQRLTGKMLPEHVTADDRTAIVLFFHDHDWEPPLLARALETEAFYIGAQGSQRARDARMVELQAMGITEDQLSCLIGPVGLIPSARDPGTLAVSVLAEVLAKTKAIA